MTNSGRCHFYGRQRFLSRYFYFVLPKCGRRHFYANAKRSVVFIRSYNWCLLADGVSNDIPGHSKCCLNIIKFTRDRISAVVITHTHTIHPHTHTRIQQITTLELKFIEFDLFWAVVCLRLLDMPFEQTFAKTFCNVNGAEYGAKTVRRKLNHIEMIKTYCRSVDCTMTSLRNSVCSTRQTQLFLPFQSGFSFVHHTSARI